MVTEEEIKERVNARWLDKQSNIDELLAIVAISQINTNEKILNTNEKLDSVIGNLNEVASVVKTDTISGRKVMEIASVPEIVVRKDIIPGDMGISLAKGSDGNIISCVINGITTNAIAKTDIGKYESIVVVPGGNFDEPYVVSTSILIKGEYDGFPINVSVNANGELQVEIQGYTAKNEPATENPLLTGMEYEALGALTTDADTVGDKVPWKASQKGVPYVTITDSQGNAEISIIEQDAAFGTDTKSIGLLGKYEAAPTTYADGDAVPICLDANGKVILSAIDVEIGAVELKNATTDDRALISDANTVRAATDHVLEVQHLDATGKVQPAGEVVTNPVHTAIGDGVETIDVETVEADIDGKNAGTTNSLMYGRESAGVTHPLHVDAQGDLIIVVTPGNTLYGELLPSASCAAGLAIEFDITSFSNLATLKQISVTQLTVGTYDYTFEIWEKDGAGYSPGTYTDHYLKRFSRDIDVREYNENIDQGLLYRDRDATQELHCRLVNNTAGTTSTFNVSVVAINST